MSKTKIEISPEEYLRLLMSYEKMNRLEAGSVENWRDYGKKSFCYNINDYEDKLRNDIAKQMIEGD